MTETSYELYMIRGPSPGTIFALPDRGLTIGRDPLSDFLINDPEISRQHALLTKTPTGEFRIQDLGSTNGTFVDGERLESEPLTLRPSNVITMGGEVTIVFRERTTAEPAGTGKENDSAPIDKDEAPDSSDSESESAVAGQQVEQDGPSEEIEVTEPDIPAEQPLREVNQPQPVDQSPAQQPEIINTAEDIDQPGQIEPDGSEGLSANLILGLMLLLLCCCLSLLVFLIYSGGDSLLRQLGVVP